MPLIKYVARKFTPKSEAIIDQANVILAEYESQGFELTLRQLYYQFVARDIIPNTQRDYKNLGSIINDARLAGLVDWSAIVDRTRNLESNPHWEDPESFLDSVIPQFQIDKWENQETRVEVWIEKDALIGVIERICKRNDVPYFSCRGYTSQSELWSASQRLLSHERNEQDVVILHLGDHDPSGKDMTRDINDRLLLFGCERTEVRRIALNMDQVRQYDPPPNPAKITDSRATKYIREFGQESWELDALTPQVIAALIQDNIDELRSARRWKTKLEEEKYGRDKMLAAKSSLNGDDE